MKEEEKNIKIVENMFAAFQKGDIESFLNSLADNVDWRFPVTTNVSAPITWAKPRHGRQEVEVFFNELFDHVIPRLKPVRYTSQDDRVVVEGSDRGKAKATGNEYLVDWVTVITLVSGKVTMLYHYFDTADVLRAIGAEIRKAA